MSDASLKIPTVKELSQCEKEIDDIASSLKKLAEGVDKVKNTRAQPEAVRNYIARGVFKHSVLKTVLENRVRRHQTMIEAIVNKEKNSSGESWMIELAEYIAKSSKDRLK